MNILWHNVVALFLTIFALTLLVRNGTEIRTFLATMKQVGPGYNPNEQVMGLLAFGLVLVAIVAVVKIVIEKSRKG